MTNGLIRKIVCRFKKNLCIYGNVDFLGEIFKDIDIIFMLFKDAFYS